MKNKLEKVLFGIILTLGFIVNVNAETKIKEDASNYSGDVYIIGSSRFDGDVIVTAAFAGRAGARETYIQYAVNNNYEYDPSELTVYYYSELDESWFELPETADDEIRSLSKEETDKLTENLNIYYVNDNEKTIEVPYNVELQEGQKLVFSTNIPSLDNNVKFENNTLLIPASAACVDIFLENSDESNMYLESIYQVDTEFVFSAVTVKTLDELKNAISSEVEEIKLGADITGINETIIIPYEVYLNGAGFTLGFENVAKVNGVASGLVVSGDNSVINDLTIEMDGKSGWQGNYALQVYNAKYVNIFNYTGTNADAALLVNASNVSLHGENDVTGNEFGGIEVSKGNEEGLQNSTLTLYGNITMEDEAVNRPVMWIEKEEGTIENYQGSFVTNTSVPAINGKEQTYFYTSESIYKDVSAVTEVVTDNEETVLKLGSIAQIIVPTDANVSSGDELTLTVEPVSTTPSYTITSGTGTTTYDISIVNQNGDKITDANEGIIVKLYVGEAGAEDVKHIVNGEAVDVDFTIDGDYIIFNTGSFSPFVIQSKYVAKVGNTKYEDLQEALNNAKNGEKIVLLSDVIYTECDTAPLKYQTQNENISATLDLNGKTVSATLNNNKDISLLYIGSEDADKYLYSGTATFTIEDSSIDMVGTLTAAPTVESDGWNVAVQVIDIERLGRLTVESGNIIMNGSKFNEDNPYGILVRTNTDSQTAELTVNGGYIESKSSSGMGVRVAAGSEKAAVKFTMNGGTIVGDSRGVWLHHTAGSGIHQLVECTINNGTIEADRALEIGDFNRDTDVSDNIKVTFGGGEFISTNNGENPSHPDYPELFSSKDPEYYNTTFTHVDVTDNR